MRTSDRKGMFSILGIGIGLVVLSLSTLPTIQADDAPAAPKKLTIPRTHPRIWWTPERIAQAKKIYAMYAFEPRKDQPWENAFCYVVTGNRKYAQAAIALMEGFVIPEKQLEGVASDQYRWNDWFPVVYDWTYDVMTAKQRKTLMDRYTHYVDVIQQKPWGGPGHETSNYYWGYFRNEFNWGIATYYEEPNAQTFLDHALITRWEKSFLPYAGSNGRGGVAVEGSQYGPYMLAYPVVPFVTARLLGRDLQAETNFFREAVYDLIYATTPAPTVRKGQKESYHQIFPFEDDETSGGYPSAQSGYLGNFMTMAAMEWKGERVGEYARQWINQVGPQSDWHVAAVDEGGNARDFQELPTDYYAPGAQYLYTRDRWGPKATMLLFQLGQGSGNHSHLDAGTFQLWRNGFWLSKESTGYSQSFAGGDANLTISHNGLLFGGNGQARAYADGPAEVLRLESRPEYAYAAVDLSKVYRASGSSFKERDDNPYAGTARREFLFVKPLETLLILDRLEASGEKTPAQDVIKTFVLHFPEQPEVKGPNTVVAVNGDQALQVVTLLPKKPQYQVVDESQFEGRHLDASFYQYRLQVNDKGQKQSYFLHAIQAREAAGKDVQASLTENATSWTVRLDHPTLGHAVVEFTKGMDSKGGSIGYSAKGKPDKQQPLTDHVQEIQVGAEGPVWGK